jgi:hypothetical protein
MDRIVRIAEGKAPLAALMEKESGTAFIFLNLADD